MEQTLEQKMAETISAIQDHHKKADEQLKNQGVVLAETKTTIDNLQKQLDAIDLKLVEQHKNSPAQMKSIADTLKEDDDVSRLIKNKKGRATFTLSGDQASDILEQKTILTGGTGFTLATGAPIGIERRVGIVPEARRQLHVRDLLPSRPTTSPLIYYVKVSVPMAIASPQVEGSAKAETTVQFTTASAAVQTLAVFVKASKQVLDDFTELEGYIRSALPYSVNKAEDLQLLSGSGTGQDLNGLVTQASAFNVALLSAAAGYQRIDQLSAAIEQVEILDEVSPTFIVLNPRDWWNIVRTKDGFGKYLVGDPMNDSLPTLWNRRLVSTTAMPSGTFLVGNGDPASVEIRDRMELQVDISTEDSDNFEKNLITIRAEKRLALLVYRPQAFITGTFATSPAGY